MQKQKATQSKTAEEMQWLNIKKHNKKKFTNNKK